MRATFAAFAMIVTLPCARLGAQGGAPGARPAERPPQQPAIATVTLPPALDRVLRDYERAWIAGDAAALAALFAPDGHVLQMARPPVRGRAGIQSAYSSNPGGPLALAALDWSASDSTGFIIGVYGDRPGNWDGKFILALRRTRGGPWLIAADMDNPIRPPRRLVPPGGAAPAGPPPGGPPR